MADNEAVRQRRHLKVITNTCHRATLWDDIAEVVEKLENLLAGQRIGVLILDTHQLGCDTVVHVCRCRFVDVAERVLQRILTNPYLCCEVITTKILLRSGNSIVILNRRKLFICRFLSHLYIYFIVIIFSSYCRIRTLPLHYKKGIIQAYKIRVFSRDNDPIDTLFFRHFIHKKQKHAPQLSVTYIYTFRVRATPDVTPPASHLFACSVPKSSGRETPRDLQQQHLHPHRGVYPGGSGTQGIYANSI